MGDDRYKGCQVRAVKRDGVLLIFERLFLTIGVVLLALFVGALIHRHISSQRALRAFDEARAPITHGGLQVLVVPGGDQRVDFSRWAEKRVRAYRESLLVKKDSPLAVLRVDKFNIRVPVFEGTDDLTLNRGVGWISGTARPGERGNIGIAGHRDGFFRVLKDVAAGDAIELSTAVGTAVYTVDEIQIVNPENVGVLRQRGAPSLTLATCYPFYFIGDAPKRFIVHAALKQQINRREFHDGSASARANQFEKEEKGK